MVVDGIQTVYDTKFSINPEPFMFAISKYDAYMAQRFIEYFKMLSKDATTPKIFGQLIIGYSQL